VKVLSGDSKDALKAEDSHEAEHDPSYSS